MLLGVVRVSRLFLKPQRAHIANHLHGFVPADQAHIVLHNFWRSHMDLPVWARERKCLASRGESLKNLLIHLDAGTSGNAAFGGRSRQGTDLSVP